MKQGLNYLIGCNTRPGGIAALQVLHAAVLLVLVRLALLILGFNRTATMLSRFSRAGDHLINVDHEQVQASTYAVSLAAAFVPARVLCLERSLVLYHKLKRKGMPAVLRLGVRAYPFGAHAWVELKGSPVNETLDRLKDFAPILELD